MTGSDPAEGSATGRDGEGTVNEDVPADAEEPDHAADPEGPGAGGEIRRLDDRTVQQIAAGEVVERPASVVKELVENSLDAGADRIEVALAAGGTDRVEVRDDGVGMDRRAVQRAIEQHTTSKLRDAEDLESGVATLGFRGEALYTIGGVARMTVTTRPREGEDAGARLRVEGGAVEAVEPAGRPPGTTVTVEDLFYNTPARRKYLGSVATEFGHVNRVVSRYALANPDVAVSLSHDGREVFATEGRGDRRAAILAVYGREVAESMVRVAAGDVAEPDGSRADEDDTGAPVDLPEGPLDGVWGYVSDPETTRSTREYVATYVNGRAVSSGTLREGVIAAYGKQLAPDRFPFAVLFCAVPAGDVDVNVHPRKQEVRFEDDAGARAQVEAAVETALLESGLVRRGAPRGRSAPDETTVPGEEPLDAGEDPPGPGNGPSDPGRDPSQPRSDPSDPTDAGADAAESEVTVGDDDRGTATVGETTTPTHAEDPRRASRAESPDPHRRGTHASADQGAAAPSDAEEPGVARRRVGDADRKFDAADQARLDGTVVEDALETATLPPLRVLGQYRETYLVAESPDGLVLVDQHAADERIHYERLRDRLGDGVDVQVLAEPVELPLTAGEAAALEAVAEEVAEYGFAAELADDRTAHVTGVPAPLADAVGPELLRDVLGTALAADPDDPVADAVDAMLGDLACAPAVTANVGLSTGGVRELLAALDACENPYSCPHGRPTIIRLDDAELEARFERDYPGHQTREPE